MRLEVDALRKVRREIKEELKKEVKIIKKNHRHYWQWLSLVLAFVILANFSFWGTLLAFQASEQADIFKLFQSGRYLVLFQNNAEIRPTGGFIGSFAVVSFQNYKISQIDFDTNIYKLDNAFAQTNIIAPPQPLAAVSQNRYTMHDANWAVSYPESAQTIQWFYEKESGQKVDGVLAINASVVQDLLRLTGPITLDKYNTTITADNFFDELAEKIEKEYFYNAQNQITNEPKTILKDMMPILIDKTKALSKIELLKLVLTELDQKQVLLQSNNETVEKAILAANWGGMVSDTAGDYLQVNNANINDLTLEKNGGAKTALKIKELIDYQVNQKDGELVSDLTLTRSHTGSYAWPDGVNINWTRVLVPLDSKLEKAELNGKDVTDSVVVATEATKTSFGLWIDTDPQTSSVLKLTYTLPITAADYNLTVQKQPGNLGDDLKVSFGDQVLYNGMLNQDKFIK